MPVVSASCDDQKCVQTLSVAPLWVKTTHSWELLITCSCLVFQVLSLNLAWIPYLQNQKIELDDTYVASSSKDIWTRRGQINRFIVFSGVGLITKLFPTLATTWTVCSPSGYSVHGISQARILEWVAISFFQVEPGSPALRQILCSVRFFKP